MSLPKTFFESTRDILRVALIAGAPVVLCLILLYSLEQVSHLYTRVELAESALEQIQQEQVVQRQSIEQSREETEAVELRLDQMDSSDLRQDLNLFLLNYGTTHLERYIRAAHACFWFMISLKRPKIIVQRLVTHIIAACGKYTKICV